MTYRAGFALHRIVARVGLAGLVVGLVAGCEPLASSSTTGTGAAAGTGAVDASTVAYLSQQTADEPFSVDQRREMQRALVALGYDIGAVDGVIGSSSRQGIRSYQATSGLPVTGFYSQPLLDLMKDSAARLAAAGGTTTTASTTTRSTSTSTTNTGTTSTGTTSTGTTSTGTTSTGTTTTATNTTTTASGGGSTGSGINSGSGSVVRSSSGATITSGNTTTERRRGGGAGGGGW